MHATMASLHVHLELDSHPGLVWQALYQLSISSSVIPIQVRHSLPSLSLSQIFLFFPFQYTPCPLSCGTFEEQTKVKMSGPQTPVPKVAPDMRCWTILLLGSWVGTGGRSGGRDDGESGIQKAMKKSKVGRWRGMGAAAV